MPGSGLGIDMELLKSFLVKRGQQAADRDDQAVIQTIGNVFPCGAVPDANDQEDDDISDTDGNYPPGFLAKGLFWTICRTCPSI